MPGGSSALRAMAAVAGGALVLHELRYVLGYGQGADHALAAQGHGYLSSLVPLVGLLAAVAAGHLLAIVARASRTGRAPASRGRFRTLWLAATVALLSTHAVQELLEGALATGHPGGVAAVVGGGGWWAVPLAVAISLAVAIVVRAADAAVAIAARRRRAGRARPRPFGRPALPRIDLPRATVLGRHLGRRAPPLASA